MKNIFGIIVISTLFSAWCRNGFYTEKDFKSVPKIDAHIHVDANDDAVEKFAADNSFVLLTLNVDHSDSAAVKNQYHHAANSVKNSPGRIFYGAAFWFDTTGFGTEAWSDRTIRDLEENLSGGAVCVKVWKNIGMVLRGRDGKFIMIDDKGLDKVFNYIKSRHLTVNGHLGEPRNCWLPLDQMTVRSDSNYFAENPQYHMFLHPEYPSYEQQLRARDNLLVKNPDMVFVASHLASLEWSVDSLAAWFDRFPNAAADISARTCHLQLQSMKDPDKVRNFIIKYQDRLLYGTDEGYHGSNPEGFTNGLHRRWLPDWKYFTSKNKMTAPEFRGEFQGLQLPKEVVEKLYYTNAVKWYNLKLN